MYKINQLVNNTIKHEILYKTNLLQNKFTSKQNNNIKIRDNF